MFRRCLRQHWSLSRSPNRQMALGGLWGCGASSGPLLAGQHRRCIGCWRGQHKVPRTGRPEPQGVSAPGAGGGPGAGRGFPLQLLLGCRCPSLALSHMGSPSKGSPLTLGRPNRLLLQGRSQIGGGPPKGVPLMQLPLERPYDLIQPQAEAPG